MDRARGARVGGGSRRWGRGDRDGAADASRGRAPDPSRARGEGAGAGQRRVDGARRRRRGGDVAWRFDARKKVFTAPAIADDGTIVFGSQDHRAYALTPAGALAWSVDLGADVDGGPAIGDDGDVFVGTDAGDVVRLRGA